jgi:hypothetical protein
VLAALGFIEVTEQGRAGNAEWRRPTQFRLTYRHTANANPTDEWRRVKTAEDAEAIARAARCEKQNASIGKRTKGRYGKRTRKPQIHSTDSETTCVSTDSETTSISRGGERKRSRGSGAATTTTSARTFTAKPASGDFIGEPRTFAVVVNGTVARVGVRSQRIGDLERGAA